MKKWFKKDNRPLPQRLFAFGEKIRNFMADRYGIDVLSKHIIYFALALLILSCVPILKFACIPSVLLIAYAFFRCFSKQVFKRNQERMAYLQFTGKIRNTLNIYKRIWKERKTHKYFKCMKCNTYVRVPKNKGRIAIRCPKCSNEVIRKT